MSQHDYVLNNASGATFRSDLNDALAAIVSANSGATAPSTTFAYQFWADTSTGLLKQRNAANTAWITVGTLASAYLGSLRPDVSNTLTVGMNWTPVKVNGTDGSGNTGTATLTPILAEGHKQYATVTGACTIEDPTTGNGAI